MKKLSLAFFTIALIACKMDPDQSQDTVVLQNWSIQNSGNKSVMVGYGDMINQTGQTLSLVAVTSDQYADIQLHQTSLVDGMYRMQQLSAVELPIAEKVTFKAGSLHLMLFEPTDILVSRQIDLQFSFSDGSTQAIVIAVD